jgi:hypothetical protein
VERKYGGDGAQETLALNIARDLALKFLERRSVSPGRIPGFIGYIGKNCRDLLQSDGEGPLPLLRPAAAITARLIERGSLSGNEAVWLNLSGNLKILKEIAETLPPERAMEILRNSVALLLKTLETRTLGADSVKTYLESLAKSAAEIFQ